MVDLNTLTPADWPLHLLFAYQINDAGDIVGQACVTANGERTAELHAFVATAEPSGHDADVEDGSAEPDVIAEQPTPYVSEGTRKRIQQQMGRQHRAAQ